MKAAILRDFKAPLTIEEIEQPKPGAHDVLIQVEACGVCHSDLHVADGDWPQLVPITKRPLILGHEIAGRAVEKGASVSHLQVGDRVGVPWDGTDPLFGAEGLPCAATMANPAAPFACFVNPFIVQNNQ